jgi:glycosyltransferase 2 family protein
MTDPGSSARPWPKRLAAWLSAGRWLITPIALCFLAYAVWTSRELLATTLGAAEVRWLVVAVVLWVTSHLVAPWLTQSILRSLGDNVPYATSWRIHCGRLPARYVPGGIWHTVARFADLRQLQIPPGRLGAWVFLENWMPAGVTLLLGGCILFAYLGSSPLGLAALGAALVALPALAFGPLIVNRWFLSGEATVGPSAYLRLLATVAAFWLVAGCAFVAYLHAFREGIGSLAPLRVWGSYLFSWGVGFVSVLTPQGIGVFEAIAAEALKQDVSWTQAAALIAGFRVVVGVADVVAWLATLLVRPGTPRPR